MNIGNVSGAGTQGISAGMGTGQTSDAQSKNIKKQIAEAEKKLQEISANEELSLEEKAKKRQETQKQISDLRMQLRQHEMELRRQRQEEKKAAENHVGEQQKSKGQGGELTAAGMQAVISADSSMKQAKVQQSVSEKMEGRAGVLEAEIEQDRRGGGNTEAKEAELAEMRKRADSALAVGMNTLKEAGRKMGRAVKEEQGDVEKAAAEERGDVEKAAAEEQRGVERAVEEKQGDVGKAAERGSEAEKTEEDEAGRIDKDGTDKNSGEANKTAEDKLPGIYVDIRL